MIVGMHRSGTSFLSSILQMSGLYIGDELMAASKGNENGHFENIDFYDFHVKVLESLSLDPDGWSLQSIDEQTKTFDTKAKAIIQKNTREEWGWKDPRTTLFLKYWENKIPNMKYLFVYRNPWDVADSLYRRSTNMAILKNPVLAFKVWDFYNREIINMYNKHQEDSILMHIDDIIEDIPGLIGKINTRFGFHLKAEKTEKVFDNSMYKSSTENDLLCWQTVLACPEIMETLNELRRLSGKAEYKADPLSKSKMFELIVAQYSFSKCNRKRQIETLVADLERRDQEIKWMKKTKVWKLREQWRKLLGKKN
jgi:hypothetical protein